MTPRLHRGVALAALPAVVALASACSTLGTGQRTGGMLTDEAQRLIVVVLDNSTGALRPEAGSTPRGYNGSGSYAVGDRARAAASALERAYGLAPLREWPIVPLHVDCLVLRLPARADRAEMLRRLSQDRRVRLAQPLQQFTTMGVAPAALADALPARPGAGIGHGAQPPGYTPPPYNDPYFGLQWGLAAVRATAAQRWSQGRNVTVAVIDTGVDVDHPDLAGRIGEVRNFVDTDARAFRTDRHGTLVAGIIAAVANNRLGIVGVAPAARVDVFKACEPLGPGQLAARCNSFTLALALSAAIQAHAQIVNLSLGGPADPLLRELVENGERRGMIFVGAVPPNAALDGFPLAIPGVIAAQSSDAALRPAAALPAPGRDVLSLSPGGHYDFASGSSFAAAHVSGALALLKAAAPRAPAQVLFAALLRSRSSTGGRGESVDVCAALQFVQPLDRCTRDARGGGLVPVKQSDRD